MDYPEYLRRLPMVEPVELHCHVEGTLRPAELQRETDRLDAAREEST